VNILTSYLLLAVGDVQALKTIVRWGYQFTILCIESLFFVTVMTSLIIADYCLQKRKAQNYFKISAPKKVEGFQVFAVAEGAGEGSLEFREGDDEHSMAYIEKMK
jgi:hypothetical protein